MRQIEVAQGITAYDEHHGTDCCGLLRALNEDPKAVMTAEELGGPEIVRFLEGKWCIYRNGGGWSITVSGSHTVRFL